MINAYFDDSSDDKRKRYVAVGGFIAPTTSHPLNRVSGWDLLELLWIDATHNLSEPFRSTDCECRHGQFSDWKKPDCDALMRDLTSLVEKAHIFGFAFVVPIHEFHEVFPGSEEYAPYYLAVQCVIASLANYGYKTQNRVAIKFEESQATSGKVLTLYNRMKALRHWKSSRALADISFGDKGVIALQAADLLAREAFKHFDNLHDMDRAIRKPLQRLWNKYLIRCVTRQALMRLKNDLKWPQELIGLAQETNI